MVSLLKLTVRSAAREIGKQFAPLWRLLAEQLKFFPDGDDEAAFIVPAHDARSQVLSIKDRSNGVGKPCVQTCSFRKRTVVCSCCT